MPEPTSPAASLETPADEARQSQATSTNPAPPPVDVVTRQDFVNAQKAWEARNRQLYEASQRLESELEQLRTKDMPDDERQSYQARRYIQQLEQRARQAEQEAAQYREEVQVQNALGRIAVRTGISLNDLRPVWDQTKDADAVWEFAFEAQNKRAETEQKRAEREERKQANRADVGSGSSTTTLSQWESALEEARKAKDTVAYTRLLRDKPKP